MSTHVLLNLQRINKISFDKFHLHVIYRGSYLSAHVLLNLLNELGFNKFNNTRARMLDSIYHMTLRLL